MGRPRGRKKKTTDVSDVSVPLAEAEDDGGRRKFVENQRLFNDREGDECC